jgi:peptidoglycan/LPS O-acetylase OafA/YrhL
MPPMETLFLLNEQPEHSKSEMARASFYRPELDVLRFLAFLAVFSCHGLTVNPPRPDHHNLLIVWRAYRAVMEAGNFGVCMFFMLSSYLITGLLHTERQATNGVHLGFFYMRRILRICPLYLSVTLIFFIGGHFLPSLHMERSQLLAYLLIAGNWYILVHPLTQIQLTWLWSISVEEQFYLVWPLVAKTGGMRWVGRLSLLLIPASVLAIATATKNGKSPYSTVWLNSLVQFQFFALGALLVLWLRGRIPRLQPLRRLGVACLGAACWLTARGVCGLKAFDANPGVVAMCVGYELVALGCTLMFLSVLGLPSRYLPRSLVYLGKISYGLYVFHEIALSGTTAVRLLMETELSVPSILRPAFFLLDRAGALALTITLAALSYKYLERPFLGMKQRFTLVRSRAA